MEALVELSRQINVFVHFFSSINNLFCHVRWLERNIRNSSMSVMIIVGFIVSMCVLMLYSETESGQVLLKSIGAAKILSMLPIVIVIAVILLFCKRRSEEGPMQGEGMDEVVFGGNHSNRHNSNGIAPAKVAYGSPLNRSYGYV
jgi:hypothetical protein